MKRKGPIDRRTEAFVCQQLTAKEWAKILVDKEAGSSPCSPSVKVNACQLRQETHNTHPKKKEKTRELQVNNVFIIVEA